jgi:NADH-quinone oxidoreductase subunit M
MPAAPPDLRVREAGALLPLMALCLWIGVYPRPLLDLIEPDVRRVARLYDDSADARPLAATAGREVR